MNTNSQNQSIITLKLQPSEQESTQSKIWEISLTQEKTCHKELIEMNNHTDKYINHTSNNKFVLGQSAIFTRRETG